MLQRHFYTAGLAVYITLRLNVRVSVQLIGIAVSALVFAGCASRSNLAFSLPAVWAAEANGNTVSEFRHSTTMIEIRPDGTFRKRVRALNGPRDRFHPQPPVEIVDEATGIWRIESDGTYWQQTTHLNGAALAASERRGDSFRLKWEGRDELELHPLRGGESLRLVRQ
jgi:hypothetical protein